MTLAKMLDECYIFCSFTGLCILMHVNFALSGHSFTSTFFSAAAEWVFSLLSNSFNKMH